METTTLTLLFKANKDNNHFELFLNPRPKPMIQWDPEDWPYHQLQLQGFVNKKKNSTFVIDYCD